MTTAEWECTRCGATNRRIVSKDQDRADDRCYHCHARHVITRGDRPPRWEASAA